MYACECAYMYIHIRSNNQKIMYRYIDSDEDIDINR